MQTPRDFAARERSGGRVKLRQVAGSFMLLALSLACTAEITGTPPGQNPNAIGGSATTPENPTASGGAQMPGAPAVPDKANTVMRRLNRSEYNNTVRDLLGTSRRPGDDLPPDNTSIEGFDTVGEVQALSLQHLEVLEQAASELIDELFALPASDARRTAVLSCQPAQGSEDTCARQIFSAFVPRAFRRPAVEAELTGLVQLARKVVAAGGSYEDGLRVALRSILLSPHFIYLVEKPTAAAPGETAPLRDHEVASRLSYLLWSSMPDAPLLAAAQAGALASDPAKLMAEFERMLLDDKAEAFTQNFAGQWLTLRRLPQVSPDPAVFPTFNAELGKAAGRETELFFEALLSENRPVATVLTADFTFVNQRLGQHYGIAASGAELQRVSLAGTERVGLLSQASFLMATSHPGFTSPTKRGVWVLEQLLCAPPPAVPPDVMNDLEPPAMGETLREKLEAHRKLASCAACHALMDPIGLGLEHFDAIGGYRADEGGRPVDASGSLGDKSFSGVKELSALLSQDPRLTTCFAQQLLTYAVGRSFSSASGNMYAAHLAQSAAGHQGVRDVLKAVVQSDVFRTRRGE